MAADSKQCSRFSPQLFREDVCKTCFRKHGPGKQLGIQRIPDKRASWAPPSTRSKRKSSGASCLVCSQKIGESESVTVENFVVHKRCFVCKECAKRLDTEECMIVNQILYCRKHGNDKVLLSPLKFSDKLASTRRCSAPVINFASPKAEKPSSSGDVQHNTSPSKRRQSPLIASQVKAFNRLAVKKSEASPLKSTGKSTQSKLMKSNSSFSPGEKRSENGSPSTSQQRKHSSPNRHLPRSSNQSHPKTGKDSGNMVPPKSHRNRHKEETRSHSLAPSQQKQATQNKRNTASTNPKVNPMSSRRSPMNSRKNGLNSRNNNSKSSRKSPVSSTKQVPSSNRKTTTSNKSPGNSRNKSPNARGKSPSVDHKRNQGIRNEKALGDDRKKGNVSGTQANKTLNDKKKIIKRRCLTCKVPIKDDGNRYCQRHRASLSVSAPSSQRKQSLNPFPLSEVKASKGRRKSLVTAATRAEKPCGNFEEHMFIEDSCRHCGFKESLHNLNGETNADVQIPVPVPGLTEPKSSAPKSKPGSPKPRTPEPPPKVELPAVVSLVYDSDSSEEGKLPAGILSLSDGEDEQEAWQVDVVEVDEHHMAVDFRHRLAKKGGISADLPDTLEKAMGDILALSKGLLSNKMISHLGDELQTHVKNIHNVATATAKRIRVK